MTLQLSMVMQGGLLEEPTLKEISQKYGKSTAQVILRWDLQNEVVTIPKSVKAHRIQENADILDFELCSEYMDKIHSLNQDKPVGSDPDEMNKL